MGLFSKLFGNKKGSADSYKEDDDFEIDTEEDEEEDDDGLVECEGCGIRFSEDEGARAYDDFYCEDCLDNKCFQCNECDEYFPLEHVCYIDENAYCEYCWETIRDSDIPDYDDNGNSDWWRDENE